MSLLRRYALFPCDNTKKNPFSATRTANNLKCESRREKEKKHSEKNLPEVFIGHRFHWEKFSPLPFAASCRLSLECFSIGLV